MTFLTSTDNQPLGKYPYPIALLPHCGTIVLYYFDNGDLHRNESIPRYCPEPKAKSTEWTPIFDYARRFNSFASAWRYWRKMMDSSDPTHHPLDNNNMFFAWSEKNFCVIQMQLFPQDYQPQNDGGD